MMNPPATLSVLPEVIVVGEALIDVVHTGNGATEHPGGSPPTWPTDSPVSMFQPGS